MDDHSGKAEVALGELFRALEAVKTAMDAGDWPEAEGRAHIGREWMDTLVHALAEKTKRKD